MSQSSCKWDSKGSLLVSVSLSRANVQCGDMIHRKAKERSTFCHFEQSHIITRSYKRFPVYRLRYHNLASTRQENHCFALITCLLSRGVTRDEQNRDTNGCQLIN